MANKLHRLLSSVIESPKPKLGIGFQSNHEALPLAIFAQKRNLSSSIPQQPAEESKEGLPPSPNNEGINRDDGEKEEEGYDRGDDSGVFVNKATGEVGGPRGPEPTRYGDWERNGRCSDF